METRQAKQKDTHDQHAKLRNLSVDSPVMVREFRNSNKWIPGTVLKKLGPVTYRVDVGEGRIWKRHIDHLGMEPQPTTVDATNDTVLIQDNHHYSETTEQSPPQSVIDSSAPQRVRYPQRVYHPPDRLIKRRFKGNATTT